mgnify:CR=1 FL=1
MSLPAGAILEAVIPHPSGETVALYDVSHLLPTKKGRPQPARPTGAPERDAEGRLVLYRLVADDRRSWHTGGVCNDHGIACALQGNLSRRDLTPDQRIVAEACLTYVTTSGRYPDLAEHPVSTHSRAKVYGAKKSKPICPGEYAERWLAGLLASRAA